jgi:hypothetical protein
MALATALATATATVIATAMATLMGTLTIAKQSDQSGVIYRQLPYY